jgi:hypothetical protein
VAAAQSELLTQDLAGVAHGQSLGGHSSPFGDGLRLGRPAPLRSGHPPPGGCLAGWVITRTDPGDHASDAGDHDADLGDHDGPILVITMLGSEWSRWAETRNLRTPTENGPSPLRRWRIRCARVSSRATK